VEKFLPESSNHWNIYPPFSQPLESTAQICHIMTYHFSSAGSSLLRSLRFFAAENLEAARPPAVPHPLLKCSSGLAGQRIFSYAVASQSIERVLRYVRLMERP
ncbi:MAG TPA: hypothetical protein VJ904_00510, partial [Tichowtungia sp.]|nr:hypothetical protein [Tichowtungia sp.]